MKTSALGVYFWAGLPRAAPYQIPQWAMQSAAAKQPLEWFSADEHSDGLYWKTLSARLCEADLALLAVEFPLEPPPLQKLLQLLRKLRGHPNLRLVWRGKHTKVEPLLQKLANN